MIANGITWQRNELPDSPCKEFWPSSNLWAKDFGYQSRENVIRNRTQILYAVWTN